MYLVPFHRAETALAGALLRLSSTLADRMPGFATVDWAKALAWPRARTGAELAAEQEQAVRLALTSKVAVLTGGPGCGKSFTVKSVITLVAAKRAKIVLAAPTGRAAKRLTALSGHPATTVHVLQRNLPYTAITRAKRLVVLRSPGHRRAHGRHRPAATPPSPTACRNPATPPADPLGAG